MKTVRRLEHVVFLYIPIALLLASVAARMVSFRIHLGNPRIAYGIEHLPGALLSASLFFILSGLARASLAKSSWLKDKPAFYFVAAVTVLFFVYWLPVLLRAGFVQDDWMLLSAASIRKMIIAHPGYSWYALDSIDGNFRPLGAVLYFGYMLKWFGLCPIAFLAGNFLTGLLASIVAFFLVRELGYSKAAGAAAAILYMSRGVIYTEIAWAADLGDGIVIVLCGLTVLAILKANRQRGYAALAYHAVAWILFAISTLAKQSSFVTPLIVALAILIRPGVVPPVPLNRRVRNALIAFVSYSTTVAIIFFHAKSLFQSKTPYPIHLTLDGVVASLSFAFWYLAPITVHAADRMGRLLIRILGLTTILCTGLVLWRVPGIWGKRPRDIVFLIAAAVSSICLFFFLAAHIAPYYGAMFSFWISIGLAIVLTEFGSTRPHNLRMRVCCLVFCLLAASGFLDIRLQQTALIPSGGYVWGTYGVDQQRGEYEQISEILHRSPKTETLVLVDFPGFPSYEASMALLADSDLPRIFLYDSGSREYLANGRKGCRPEGSFTALNAPENFNWTVPMNGADALNALSQRRVLWMQLREGRITASQDRPFDLAK